MYLKSEMLEKFVFCSIILFRVNDFKIGVILLDIKEI